MEINIEPINFNSCIGPSGYNCTFQFGCAYGYINSICMDIPIAKLKHFYP